MYKRKQHKKLRAKNESFLNVTSLRNRDSPEAGVSCLILQVRSTFYFFVWRRVRMLNECELRYGASEPTRRMSGTNTWRAVFIAGLNARANIAFGKKA